MSVLYAPAEADLATLGLFGRQMDEAPPDPRALWHRVARPDQRLPDTPFRVMYFQGGRGSGKTRSGAEGFADVISEDPEPEGQYGVIGPTYRDAWTVQVEGESGLLRALGTTPGEVKQGKSRVVAYAHRSYGEIGLRDAYGGHVIFVDSADDGAIRVQGKNLRGAWCGEIGLWTRWAVAWDESIKFAVRKGDAKIICDGTPKVSRPARALIRRFLRGEEPGCVVRRLRTVDNAANLSEAFYQSVIGTAKGTRLERQELEGELLDDIENALWTRALLEGIQVPAPGAQGGIPYLYNAVIGVDPSDGNEDSDEQAYTVAGKGDPSDHHLYVAENWGGQMAPAAFARKVILKAVEWNARIVVEKNHGGAWLTTTFHQVMKDLDQSGKIPDGRKPRVETIHASQAKRTRAEPVSALYERGLVRHCYQVDRYQVTDRQTGDAAWHADRKGMVELEDQMSTFTGASGERSPDRLDSLVWALTPFLNTSFGPPGTPGIRKWAGSAELDGMGVSEETKAHRRMREIAAKAAPGIEDAPWGIDGTDLDGFAPSDERDARPRGNVRSWR